MPAPFKLTAIDPQDADAALTGGEPLRRLCRKEVEEFDVYMREHEPNWAGGLAAWEKQILLTFLYQKMRGRLDGGPVEEKDSQLPLPL